MKIQNVKGCYDYIPEEQRIRNYINDTLKKIFTKYGYQPIETPLINYYDMLSDKYDEDNDILKEIYKLRDQGNRELGLRYDLTVPLAKFITINKNRIQIPFKRYEIAKVFRDGPIKPGRDREFTQCDIDAVGIEGQMVEAELLEIFTEAFKELNIDIIIKYNSRKLLNGLILESGANEENLPSILTIIDKKEKITKEEFKDNLLKIGLTTKNIDYLNECFNLNLIDLQNKYQNTENKLIQDGLKELNDLNEYLKNLKIEKYTEFTPTLVRGQNYYTGNIFEVYDKEQRITSSIGAGGRYDNMITNFINDGENYPAVGISFGLSSIYEILKNKDYGVNSVDIYIIPLGTRLKCMSIANILRKNYLNVDMEMRDVKLKKSLNYANQAKIPYVMVIGEDELKTGIFTVKDMKNGKTITVFNNELDKLLDILRMRWY